MYVQYTSSASKNFEYAPFGAFITISYKQNSHGSFWMDEKPISILDAANAKSLPVISFIIPFYNAENYLNRAITSVACQTLRNIEIILVDDCGTDGSLAIAEQWAAADKRIRIIKNQTNSGAGVSRDFGMYSAVGEFAAFVDSDDYIAPDWAAVMLSAAWNTGAEIIVSGAAAVYPDGFIADYPRGFNPRFDNGLYTTPREKFRSHVVWGTLLRRDFIEKENLHFLPLRVAEDAEFMFTASALAKSVAIETRASYYYIQRSDSLTGGSDGRRALYNAKCQLYAAEKILQNFAEGDLPDKAEWIRLAEMQLLMGVVGFMLLYPASAEGEALYEEYRAAILAIDWEQNRLVMPRWKGRIIRIFRLAATHDEFVKLFFLAFPRWHHVGIQALAELHIRRTIKIGRFYKTKLKIKNMFRARRASEWHPAKNFGGRIEMKSMIGKDDFMEAVGSFSYGDADIFQNYFLENNMPEKIAALKDGLDQKSKDNIDLYIRRMLVLPNKKTQQNFKIRREFVETFQTEDDRAANKAWNENLPLYKKQIALDDEDYSAATFLFRHGLGTDMADEALLQYIAGKDFIDGGAYVGDTALMLAKNYNPKRVWSFEVSAKNRARFSDTMKNNSGSEKCVLVPTGLGESKGEMFMDDEGGAEACVMDKGGDKVSMTDLDSFVRENNLSVGFVKMDLEGFGLQALKGMKETIKKHRPVLSLAIYHNPTEFFEILPRLREICGSGYEFFVRQFNAFYDGNHEIAVFAKPKGGVDC
ncbi:MAG: FkbM family methyltransferase [Rickettsiales bacterium]|nr:FkbM family methyltransferase [Rickettsiales bacterium]